MCVTNQKKTSFYNPLCLARKSANPDDQALMVTLLALICFPSASTTARFEAGNHGVDWGRWNDRS
ncbi:hypothetical protein V6Z11_A11G174700 [Gossypium hirsutum]